MELNGTYYFEEINKTITNPVITDIEVSDRLINKTANIRVYIEIDTKLDYSHLINPFVYVDTWEDLDIINWVGEQLEDYKV